jgi:uncharacterized protein (DUF885 family)
MPSLAYHEAIPGHHYQIDIARQLELPSIRHHLRFTAYTEGWALYAERLAFELGWYESDPYGDLGRLQYEAWRAVRLVVDTGIHAKRWSFNRAVDYMIENTGLERYLVQGQISRYVVWPGQATAYMIGMLEILDLRQKAEEELGENFDLKEFHNLILGTGSVPLDILQEQVEAYYELDGD